MDKTFFVLFCGFVSVNSYDRQPHKMEVLVERFKFGDYYFVFYSKSANWAEAHTICQATRSRLAVVNTMERAKFLADALSQTKTGFEDVWIGGRFSKDTWQWVPIAKSIAPPHNNFPPWLNYPTKRGKNCLSLDRKNHRDPIFVDLKCGLYRPFICEESVSGSVNKFPEVTGEIVISSRRYFLYHARVTWQEALAFCKQSEARLATIPDLDVATKLVELMKRNRPPFENVWIGARRDYLGWMWVPTSQELANITQKDGFPPWRFNYPSDNMKSCVILDHHPCLNPYHIHLLRFHLCEEPVFIEENCGLKKDFLCEIADGDNNDSLKPNLITTDKITYIFYEEPLSWVDAMTTCEKFNMTLAMPETARQWETIVTHMGDMQRELYHVWLRGKWVPNKWVWLNNHSIPLPEANSSYPPWCLSMNIHEDEEDCINLDRDAHNTPLIYGYNCSMLQSFICQLEGADFIDTSDLNTNHEFVFYRNGLTYFEAEYDCKLNHSYLAMVNNSKIAQNVALLLPRDTLVWVGARRIQGVWRWTKTREILPDSSDASSYPPWENTASVLDKSVCLAIKSGYREQPFFVEMPCKEKLSYLCQRDQKEAPQPNIILYLNGAKFYFYKNGVPWSEALSICNSEGLHLINVGNLELGSFLLDGMADTVPIWTSGKLMTKESWSWVTSGSNIPNQIKLGYPPWVNNIVPDDMQHACLQLNKSNTLLPLFEAEDCLQNHSFVCVDKIFIQNETQLQMNNFTISLQDILTNIEKARKACIDSGKSVIDITKLGQENILKLMKTENVKSLWIDVIRDKNGKWIHSNTMKEYVTKINFPDRDNYTVTDPKNCLTLHVSPEETLTLVPSLCSDFSRMICVAEVNESTHVAPHRVEHVLNETATITAILENTIHSLSSLVCNDLGGDMIGEELLKPTIEFFKSLDPAYKSFWLDATYHKNNILNSTKSGNSTNKWMWSHGTPVLLEGLPDESQVNVNNIEKNCLIYNREDDSFKSASCSEKHSSVCEKVERKCKPKIQHENFVIWPDKCTLQPVSGGTVCRATCPAGTNLLGPANHVCSKGKWSYSGEIKCQSDKFYGPELEHILKKNIKTLHSSLFLFILDYGVPKVVFQASLQFTKNLANTVLLNNNRRASIEMYSYVSRVTDLLENNNCYLIHTVDELERKSEKSNSEPNYYSAFKTAEDEFEDKNATGVIFFFALRPDRGSMNKMEIINRLKANGIIIVVISIGDDVNRSLLEEIASTKDETLQLYAFDSLKGLKEASFFLKKRRKFTLNDCPRVGGDPFGK